MKLIFLVILGSGIFEVVLSKNLIQMFGDWLEEIFDNQDSDSSEEDDCKLFSELFDSDSDSDSDYDDDDESDDSSEVGNEQVQLPGGPAWLETMHHLTKPQAPGYHPGNPGHQQPVAGVNEEQPPLPLQQTQPFPLLQQQQQQQQPQDQQGQQQTPPLVNGSQSIPTSPPVALDDNDTSIPSDSLIISLPGDDVDDTDGEGVLVGEEETG